MRLPDFYIIGAAKSGTTSLHAILDKHPGIFMPETKEPEFFARDDIYEKGIGYYADLFAEATDSQLIGEASPIYSMSPYFPNTASRIRKHTPDAKFIFIMREPVSRAFSVYGQLIKNYQNASGDLQIHRTFEEFISPELCKHSASRDKVLALFDAHLPDDEDLCLVGGYYLYQIQCYPEHFPIDRFLFLKNRPNNSSKDY